MRGRSLNFEIPEFYDHPILRYCFNQKAIENPVTSFCPSPDWFITVQGQGAGLLTGSSAINPFHCPDFFIDLTLLGIPAGFYKLLSKFILQAEPAEIDSA